MRGLVAPPKGPWAPIWILGPLLALAALGWIEHSFRALGMSPGMASRIPLWCHHRQRLEGGGDGQVALIGGSRMQMGLQLPVFSEELPGFETIQLASAGTGPGAALHDLAGDESFHGIVVCSANSRLFQPAHLHDQRPLVDYYRQKWGPGEDLALIFSAPFQLRLALLQPSLSAPIVIPKLLRGEVPGANYVTTQFNRTRVPDYTKVDLERVIESRMATLRAELATTSATSPKVWLNVVARLAEDARRIEARGGRVVFLQLPTRGRYAVLESEFYPREKYWDVFAEHVGALTIHSSEMPGHETLVLPDESHLDHASGERFTRWVAHELIARGVVPSP